MLEYQNYSNIITNENDVETPCNTFSNLTIGNATENYLEEMNDIIALVIIDGKACFEQQYLMLPTTLDAMIDIRKKILTKNPKELIRSVVIIPPNKQLR